jgi:hypothetical protein
MGGRKERILRSEEDEIMLHTHTHINEDNIMKPTKHCLKRGRLAMEIKWKE